MGLAVAARIPGSLIADIVTAQGEVRVGNPSGVLPAQADVQHGPFRPRSPLRHHLPHPAPPYGGGAFAADGA